MPRPCRLGFRRRQPHVVLQGKGNAQQARPPQAAATRAQMSERLQDTQAADNFQNLFETPVLFYALCAMAMAQQRMPDWLVAGAWAYVSLRVVHTLIHCTYNRVMHRLAAFLASFVLLVILWAAWVISGL
ncbi:MAPEG family protein [Ideonella paludis]|uniref:MAPEG family protein n=1 Tax=Ideonella paludis TaxID=1233411 RepID=UPI00363F2FE9